MGSDLDNFDERTGDGDVVAMDLPDTPCKIPIYLGNLLQVRVLTSKRTENLDRISLPDISDDTSLRGRRLTDYRSCDAT